MTGSDFTFGGRRDFFTQHEIWDYNTAIEIGKLPVNYREGGWGFENKMLYKFA